MSNFKKLVEQRMAKTGESWSTASRHVRNAVAAPVIRELASAPDPIDALVAGLRPYHESSILVGRIPAVGASASAEAAARRARDLAEHPKYFGQSASVEKVITHDEMR